MNAEDITAMQDALDRGLDFVRELIDTANARIAQGQGQEARLLLGLASKLNDALRLRRRGAA